MAREGKVLLDEILELLDSSRQRTQKLLDADSASVTGSAGARMSPFR